MSLTQAFRNVSQLFLFGAGWRRIPPWPPVQCTECMESFYDMAERQASKVLYMVCMCIAMGPGIWVLIQRDADLQHFPTQARPASCPC